MLWERAAVLLVALTATRRGCGLQFYRFPEDIGRRARWVTAVDRKNWEPNWYTWICSAHFVGGVKNNDPASSAYVPSLFSQN